MAALRFLVLFAAAVLAAQTAIAADRRPVVAFGVLEHGQYIALKEAFEAKNPDLELTWVSDSSGVVAARIKAEAGSPSADVALGVGGMVMQGVIEEGLVEPYSPKDSDLIPPQFKDAATPRRWTGLSGYFAVICFNTKEAEKAGISAPTSFEDLLRPEFRGKVVMPHPASSSVGYMSVAHWLQSKGESEGWAFMDRLHQNIAAYLHSGSAPCAKVGQGEYLAAIGLDAAGAAQKLKGAPIALILPSGGAAWDIDTAVLLKGARNPEGGQRLLDFSLSREAAVINARYRAILSRPDVEPDPAGFPAVPQNALAAIDFSKFGAERDAILDEWKRRYEGKAAPK